MPTDSTTGSIPARATRASTANTGAVGRLLAGAAQGAALAACAVAAALLAFGCSRETPARPNVVVVVLDTVRRDYTGCGPGESYTPNMDSLMAEGTGFTNAWATAPWTPPSHASIFTGRLPSHHQCTAKNPMLPPEVTSLAERLQEEGYETAAFHSNPWLTLEMTDLTRGFDVLHEPEAIRNIRAWLDTRDASRPFFMFVNILEAHLPFDPPESYRRVALTDLPPEARVRTHWANEYNSGVHPHDRINWHNVRRLYAGDVHAADAYLGTIVDELRSRGLYEEAVIIVTSDHGENLGEHGLMSHQFGVFETLLAVPLVVRAPGALRTGVRDDPTMLSDLYATILDLTGTEDPDVPEHSRSLLLEPAHPDRPMIAEYSGPPYRLVDLLMDINPSLDPTRFELAHATVRVGDLRLTLSSDGRATLEDQSLPPEKRTNMARSDASKVRTMSALIPCIEPPPDAAPAVDEEMARWLRSLGYM